MTNWLARDEEDHLNIVDHGNLFSRNQNTSQQLTGSSMFGRDWTATYRGHEIVFQGNIFGSKFKLYRDGEYADTGQMLPFPLSLLATNTPLVRGVTTSGDEVKVFVKMGMKAPRIIFEVNGKNIKTIESWTEGA